MNNCLMAQRVHVWPVSGEPERFFVLSRSRPAITHIVDSNWEGGWGCSCEQFQVRGLECPHIRAVKERWPIS